MANLPHAGRVVLVTMTLKGGAGKTETADVAEAAFTLGGHRCVLVDADDGNRGLGRRIGLDNVIKLSWTSGAEDAPDWIARHAGKGDRLIFDLGAGIGSADLPIMAFLGSVWRMLQQGGARIIFLCIVSTNAPTATSFVERVFSLYGRIGEVIILCNNQDGSGTFLNGVAERLEPKVRLGNLAAGIQAVRLMRKEPLSAIIAAPMPDYTSATAIMASRVHAFASQAFFSTLVDSSALARLSALSGDNPKLLYTVTTAANATDARIAQNARLAAAQRALLAPALDEASVLAAAKALRRAHAEWKNAGAGRNP